MGLQMNDATRAFALGQWARAEIVCRALVSSGSGDELAAAAHLLGLTLFKTGRGETAIDWLQRAAAVAAEPSLIEMDLAVALEKLGRLQEALSLYDTLVCKRPKDAKLQFNRGVTLGKLGRMKEAALAYREAAILNPTDPMIFFNLGLALQDCKEMDLATIAFRHSVELGPTTKAYFHLGFVLHQTDDLEGALAAYDAGLEIQSDLPALHCNRGAVLGRLGRSDESMAAFETAVRLNPSYAEALSNLGSCLAERDRFDDAIVCLRRAVQLQPNYASGWSNLGNALLLQGDLDQALVLLRWAVSLAPTLATARHNLAIGLLSSGQWSEGFAEYEWRWQLAGRTLTHVPLTTPAWQGEAMPGKTLLVITEQGHGDTVNFCRYLSLAAQRVGKVILACPSVLYRLLSEALPGIEVVSVAEAPPHDAHVALLGLPRCLGLVREAIGCVPVPYLAANPGLAARWARRLGTSASLKVGLVWAGNPGHQNDHRRSIGLDRFLSLPWPPGVLFFSLQKGDAAADIERVGAGRLLIDLASEIADFADLAAVMNGLDLIITVDSAPAHLAGALGRPVWTLLPYVADWRWSQEKTSETPWYPSMRLYRQEVAGDWDSVLQRVGEDLIGLSTLALQNLQSIA